MAAYEFYYFKASWCKPCEQMTPLVQELKPILERMGDVEVHVVDVEENPDLSRQVGVRSVPTFLLFRNGGSRELLFRHVGTMTRTEFLASLMNAIT